MPNASDIITYIGIPLAVLGVLPILYTAINSLITIRRIQATLIRNGLSEAITRGSLMSGIVEVSLPRYSITPLDREEDEEYWELNPRPSSLKGGTWTAFHWNCLITGSKLYRLQYSDDLQVPQAEIEFEELMGFLLDRGAVPDVKGLRMLRLSGLWTPTGTSLMLSPDTLHCALKVSVPNDSDGVLSLALHWEQRWDRRDPNFMPPGWMRVNVPLKVVDEPDNDGEKGSAEKASIELFPLEDDPASLSAAKPPRSLKPTSLRFRLGHLGSSVTISNAMWENENVPLTGSPSLDHVRSAPASTWVPSIALALGLSQSLPLYNHTLDPTLSTFVTRDTVPCGVLVILGLLDESEAPPWETKYSQREHLLRFRAEFDARQRERAAENMQQRRERSLKRQQEAVCSARLDTVAVADASAKYLKAEQLLTQDRGTQDVVEALLVGMIKREGEAMNVCAVLQRWREWSDRGGMTIEDLEFLEKHRVAFCNAACAVSVLKDVSTKKESAVATDMRDCVQNWRKVRLG